MEEENKTGRVSEVLEEQIIVGVGAVNLTPKAEVSQQEEASLQHNQEDESPEAVIIGKKCTSYPDYEASNPYAASCDKWCWLIGLKQIHPPLTDAEMKQRGFVSRTQYHKMESARQKYLMDRREAKRLLAAARRKRKGI